jgi:quercetin dioxygenase-like cupin family protein
MQRALLGLALGLAVLTGSPALSSEDVASADTQPSLLYESTFPMPQTLPAPPAGPLQLFHYVVSYAPGAQTVYHQHPAGCVATMIEGQVTNHFLTSRAVAGPGKTIVTPANETGYHRNDSSTTDAVYYASCWAPADDPFAIVDELKPLPIVGAEVLFASGMPVSALPGQFSVVQRILDFDAGASTGQLTSNSHSILTVLSGQLSVSSDGGTQDLGPGGTFVATGKTYSATNAGASMTRVVETLIVTGGAAPPATGGSITPPSTGDGGLK